MNRMTVDQRQDPPIFFIFRTDRIFLWFIRFIAVYDIEQKWPNIRAFQKPVNIMATDD